MKNPLGTPVSYPSSYSPELLFPIERASYRQRRASIGGEQGGWLGEDRWRCYEFSWLQPERPPAIAIVELSIPADSPRIVESKSLKLYLGSFAQTPFSSVEEVSETVSKDISACVQAPITARLSLPEEWAVSLAVSAQRGVCIDSLSVPCSQFQPNRELLTCSQNRDQQPEGEEDWVWFHSHLLRTLCPVTQQPDWASVELGLRGASPDPQSLLQYLVSFREHLGFHEACCEQIAVDCLTRLAPAALWVSCSFTRRGGIDITPSRSWGVTPAEHSALAVCRAYRQ